MKIFKCAAKVAILLIMSAAQAAGKPEVEKPYITTSQSLTITDLVEAIDYETRKVTIRNPQGTSVTLTVGEEVLNLEQVKVGDTVTTEYVQNLSIKIVDNPELAPSEQQIKTVNRAEKGEMPWMTMVDEIVVTTVIEGINIEANTIQITGPNGTVEEFTVNDPENLKRVSVGDRVIITQTDKTAISVERAETEQE
jgi:Cu/Ag efflux protein CusF